MSSSGTAGQLADMASLRAFLPSDRAAAQEAVVALNSKSEGFEDIYLLVEVIGIVA